MPTSCPAPSSTGRPLILLTTISVMASERRSVSVTQTTGEVMMSLMSISGLLLCCASAGPGAARVWGGLRGERAVHRSLRCQRSESVTLPPCFGQDGTMRSTTCTAASERIGAYPPTCAVISPARERHVSLGGPTGPARKRLGFAPFRVRPPPRSRTRENSRSDGRPVPKARERVTLSRSQHRHPSPSRLKRPPITARRKQTYDGVRTSPEPETTYAARS